ncbi:zinc-dependent metalloprotease [Streptomyces sp. NPDC057638]|uniref:zinc-dependent metalloprotease n=1 Tax=Streptomyces sp. NPDC057638 TaxID=3346190 RepID=UPI0036A70C24
MPQIDIRLTAGRAHRDFGERLRAVAEETVPVVEAVTQLPLPDPVVIRTLTPRRWLRDHKRSTKRRLTLEMTELGLSAVRPHLGSARASVLGGVAFLRTHWVAIGGQAVEYAPDRPEVVICPEALRHCGRLDDLSMLYKIVAHEVTHLAQYAASGGAVWRAQSTHFPALRGTTDLDYHWLLEGHAYAMDQRITAKILGAPVRTDTTSPRASARHREVVTEDTHRAQLRHLDQAADGVEGAIDRLGLDTFNRIWTSPDLIPLEQETGMPEQWWGRWS